MKHEASDLIKAVILKDNLITGEICAKLKNIHFTVKVQRSCWANLYW